MNLSQERKKKEKRRKEKKKEGIKKKGRKKWREGERKTYIWGKGKSKSKTLLLGNICNSEDK